MREFYELNPLPQIGISKIAAMIFVIGCIAGAPSLAQAGDFFNGFEVDATCWFSPTRVASGAGTLGVSSADGSWHAESTSGDYTRWGGYDDNDTCSSTAGGTFPVNGYDTSVDIYLDVDAGFANDTRFDFSSAINNPSGTHRRDFIFGCGFYASTDNDGPGAGTNRFICSASNNAPGWPKNPGREPTAVASTSGWYTFLHQFRNDGSGVLTVDLSVLDSSGTVIKTWTLSDATDVINSTVGGNRYGWFVNNGFGTLAIDNSERTSVVDTGFDNNVTPDVIFGSGNSNGKFTTDRQGGIELGLRAKIPFAGLINSNGDGTYSYTLAETGTSPNRRWNFDWTVNTDFDGSSGLVLDDLTYELGMDADPGLGVDFLKFDPITPTVAIPFYDHSIGDNTTANGAGVEAGDAATYAALLASKNVLQQSWRYAFFSSLPPMTTYDSDVPGTYAVYLLAKDSTGAVVARTDIQVLIGGAPKAGPYLACVGFEPPMNLAYLPPALGGGVIARRVKRNRVFPFKATLVDSDGNIVTDITAPKIKVLWNDTPLTSVNVTDQALVNGKRTDGTDFFLAGDKWHFNLASRGFLDAGNHTGIMVSGDGTEYVVEPTCEGVFVIEP